ncbi:hypothetical protein [Legionella israelensis]|uniref:Uncharacterized protein n=1 Tax=Legionella israelensis TaxID=454 RepID=A0A0W0VKK2_9GAMM|nr:hypothetical protein [Legionella israelensis]KTD20615.1 hypothetical protein Lisr_1689 [Legionella israelensis]QBS10512.1 hypothetical protein E4T55_12030 [Legionella israelensis]SCY56731.1 hypothetical protein SAMN02746069_02888 [Legionella israelensis DSM 19235]STX57442.1 Uncharacterised protein [Legionella israelensis]STX60162.1 Uncharacterised protein [Legionella israelensis]
MSLPYYLFIFSALISTCSYSSIADLPIKSHGSYIVNYSDYPITVRYKSCRDHNNQYICDKNEFSISIDGKSSKYIGNYTSRNGSRDGKLYIVTLISNNVRTKEYSDDLAMKNQYLPTCIIRERAEIDDFGTINLFCTGRSHAGIKA